MLVNKEHRSRRGIGSSSSPSCIQSFIPTHRASGFKCKEGLGEEGDRHPWQPPSNVRASTVAGVGGSVKKLTLKVSKQRCLSFSGRSFVVLPGPPDRPKRPVGLPLDEVSVIGSFHGPAWGSGELPACECALVLAPGVH